MKDLAKAAAGRLQNNLRDAVEEIFEDKRGVVVRVKAASLLEALKTLNADADCPFEMLADVTAVDWSRWTAETEQPAPAGRFSLYYNLYSLKQHVRLFLETNIGENQAVHSATSVYASADWGEREVFDMFGIRFIAHPDLRRIFMPDDFEHYPLRKEFPIQGYDPQDYPQE
jgi:NADH-quinone oxidoreductase subunit C